MCKVHNQIGSLTAIKTHLRAHNVQEYKSLNELINFQNNYSDERRQVIVNHRSLIEQERDTLSAQIVQLKDSIHERRSEVEQRLRLEIVKLKDQLVNLPSIHANPIRTCIAYFKRTALRIKIWNKERKFDSRIAHTVLLESHTLTQKFNRYEYIVSCFEDAVNEGSFPYLQKLEVRKRIIDEINTSIYGALGEQKVVKELEKLSDDYILINDFTCAFHPPIYHRRENEYIRSIQIDHILIAPSGIFLIETKNWSQRSLGDLSLRSPVQQIKRTNFALYKILTGEINSAKVTLTQHHWGDRKVPIRNLIVLINHRPSEVFQYVKILTLKELLGYVKYFEPCLSGKETQLLGQYLLSFDRPGSAGVF